MFKISTPTKAQIISSVERVVFVFVTVFLGVWIKTPHPFTEAAIWGSILAAATAVYSLAKSVLTTL